MSSNRRKTLVGASASCLLLFSAACSSGAATESAAPGAEALDPSEIGPDSIVGQGPDGAAAASVDDIQLSDADAEKVRAGNFEVALVMHTENLDWSQLQIQGIRDTLDKYGVRISNITAAEYDVSKQVSDIENVIQQRPDGIISIPVDNTATAPAYEQVQQAGIKLVLMDNVPQGLVHGEDYASMISADSVGNGQIAAEILASYVPDDGAVGIIDFGIDFFVTNERTRGVEEWLAENRPDITIKETAFTDPSQAGQVAGDFLTSNPDLDGSFTVWDAPALDTLSAMRAAGSDVPLTTIDLGLETAIEIASGGPLKGLGAQRPYDQGVAEALAMMQALIGNETPAWVGVQSLPVVQANVLEAYETVFHEAPPQELVDACEAAGSACG
ncbi:substrate-binding domain-containing protein [Geodermatophilus sp. SYSU D00703]